MLMKSQIREHMKRWRADLAPEDRAGLSQQIFEKASTLFEPGKHVLVFVPMDDEVDTRSFFLMCPNLSVPKVLDKKKMIAVSYDGEMAKSSFGVMEPISDKEALGIEVAIVPGLAFDKRGNRIGYGAGYYDRFLSAHPNILKIGVCYDFQVIEGISPTPTDVPMNYVVTEQAIYKREN